MHYHDFLLFAYKDTTLKYTAPFLYIQTPKYVLFVLSRLVYH